MRYVNSGLYDTWFLWTFDIKCWFYFEEILIFDTFITVPLETFSFKIYFLHLVYVGYTRYNLDWL